MLTIGDLVSVDERAEFRNDVQLDAFDNPQQNLALLNSYLFTATEPGREPGATRLVSSTGLLNAIVESYVTPQLENRQVVVANYGHGKSHLALALANYFSRPASSEEVRILLDKIDRALNDPAKASRFRDFKESRGEFLVIRLRGDIPRSLREQFLAGLERSLREHPATENVQLQFWFAEAEAYLQNLGESELQKANAFLEPLEKDVPLLLQDLKERRDVYDICVDLVRHLVGVRPDFGGEVSLKEALNQIVKEYCGEGKPLGGVLILFDEFSLYIQRYAQRNAVGELQDLLNGVDDCRGKVVFLAFAQHAPMTTAENVAMSSQARESLKHELTRLPREYQLYSLMESVIDAYLKQSERAWQDFLTQEKVPGSLFQATDVTMESFRKRYENELRWGTETFQETVTKGCFPLHPLTTALLCGIKFREMGDSGVPRTILGFVMEQLDRKRDEPATVDGRINWVLPITLVDYFESRLAPDLYMNYENARRTAGPEASDDQKAILKALLLQEAAELSVSRDRQLALLAQAAGLTPQETHAALNALRESNSLYYNPAQRKYVFWPSSANPQKLEQIVRGKQENQTFDREALSRLNSSLSTALGVSFGSISVDVQWGHPQDWAAREVVFTREFFTSEELSKVIQPTQFTARGLQEGDRGYVLWLLGQSEDEVEWFRQKAAQILDEVFPGDNPLPIIAMLPSAPGQELISAFQRMRALENFSQEERAEVGQEMYRHELGQAKAALLKQLARLRGDNEHPIDILRTPGQIIVPFAYRAAVNSLPRPALRHVLGECYRVAYRYRPPEFFTQYRVASQGQNKLRDATKTVANLLLHNASTSLRHLVKTNAVVRDLCQMLISKWHLLTPEYRIKEPDDLGIDKAWELFSQTFVPEAGEVKLADVLIRLMNPPYGYDYNTAVLVFSAWFGYNAHDLQVSTMGRMATQESLEQAWKRGAKDFVQEVYNQSYALTRRKPRDIENEVRVLIERSKMETFAQEETLAAIETLATFERDERGAPDLRDQARQAIENLQSALEIARDYDAKANKIAGTIARERSVSRLIPLLQDIRDLPDPDNVAVSAPSPAELQSRWREQLEVAVDEVCRQYGELERTTQLELHQKILQGEKKSLQNAGLSDLAGRVEDALRRLKESAARLRKREQEATVQAQIKAMDPKARLKTLYEYRDVLRKMSGYSGQTMHLRDTRLEAIGEEINQLEKQAGNLFEAVSQVDSIRAVEAWREQMLKISARYSETPFQEQLDQAGSRIGRLRAFFTDLRTLQSSQLNTPTDVEKILQKVEQLEQQYNDVLGDRQREVLAQAVDTIQEQAQTRREQARRHLSDLERQFQAGVSSVQLKAKFHSPPTFLPADELPRWQALHAQIQERIDQDIVAKIEEQFRQIADPAQRQRCLTRLQEIMREVQPA